MRRALSTCALATILAACAGCFPVPPNIASPDRFDARQIEGTWYVIATNFPSWLGDDNKNARLSYKIRKTPQGVVELDDLVAFEDRGSPASYAGVDTQDPANDAHFTWRGNGFLALFPTEWYVAKVDPNGAWIITYYGDTLVAADAVDVIAKHPHLSDAELASALAAIDEDPVLKKKAKGIKRVYLYGDAPKP